MKICDRPACTKFAATGQKYCSKEHSPFGYYSDKEDSEQQTASKSIYKTSPGLQKQPRIVNEELLEEVRHIPCLNCVTTDPWDSIERAISQTAISEAHHLKTRGAFGHDVPHNVISVCRRHHIEIHQIGITATAEKYPVFKSWLKEAGWLFDSYNKKWSHPNL